MKKSSKALTLALALMMALVPATGLAAGWQYSPNGSFGVVIYMPQEGQTIHTDEGFTYEFDLKYPANAVTFYEVSFYAIGADGATDYTNQVKTFNVNSARKSSDRYVISLNVSDIPAGTYAMTFVLSNEDYSQMAIDERRVNIVKRDSEWVQYGSKWSYKRNGQWATNNWTLINGKWYRFDAQGYMVTGWKQIGSGWYYLGSDGVMRTGWHAIGGKWYCFRNDGLMYANAWLRDGNDWYMINPSGAMLTGWQKDGNTWYYLQSSGKMFKGWLSLGGKWYYLDGNGKMVTGTATIDGKRYTFNGSGVMQ